MLKLISGLPDTVLGVSATGEVTSEDYEKVLVPAIEMKLARFEKLRLIYRFEEGFSAFSASALWEDTKVGMRHLTRFERIAVVTDVEWLAQMIKGLGFVLPGDVRVFGNENWEVARSWIGEPAPTGELRFELDRERGILLLHPTEKLQAGDFKRVADTVDEYVASNGPLAGVMIVAESFPGWDDFAAFASHLRFVRDHHDKIRRVALVTESPYLIAVPALARLFVAAEVRRFETAERDAALAWVSRAGAG